MIACDAEFLSYAIRQAQRGLGRTWPNPSVGCALVKDGQVIAIAHTADGGRPHAETIALQMAGAMARGATAYVSLEPCAHHGKTPPCSQALIDAGIARVVVGARDPDPRVNGQGIALLERAGIEVITDHPTIGSWEDPNRGFFSRIQKHRPYVTMKIATDACGQMVDPSGTVRWITGEAARAHGHGLRNQADAVLTGIGTVLADNPMLNVRLPGIRHDRLVRIVADRQLRLPLNSQLVRTARLQPTWVFTTPAAIEQAASHATELREAGVTLHALDAITPTSMLKALAAEGITRLLVEAGPMLSNVFIQLKQVDTLYWYRAPLRLGDTGNSTMHALDSSLRDVSRQAMVTTIPCGDDRCEVRELGN